MHSTLVLLKPDAIERKLVDEIISVLEKEGFSIIKIKKGKISSELAQKLYSDSKEQLVGMGNKALKAMKDNGMESKIQTLFFTTDPFDIGKKLNTWNRNFVTSCEIIAMVIEGNGGATKVREIIGSTDPLKADKTTIRGKWAVDSIPQAIMEKRACRNLIHASDDQKASIENRAFL